MRSCGGTADHMFLLFFLSGHSVSGIGVVDLLKVEVSATRAEGRGSPGRGTFGCMTCVLVVRACALVVVTGPRLGALAEGGRAIGRVVMAIRVAPRVRRTAARDRVARRARPRRRRARWRRRRGRWGRGGRRGRRGRRCHRLCEWPSCLLIPADRPRHDT